jgi:hypothetical protein
MSQLTQLIVAFLAGGMVCYLNIKQLNRVINWTIKRKAVINTFPKLRLIKGIKKNNVSSKSNN